MMRRIIRIVVSPRDEWARIAGEQGHGALAHTVLLSAIPAAASFNSDLKLPGNAMLAAYLASLLAIFAVAAAFWLLARFDSRDESLRRCFQVAAYGATPVLVASALVFTPVLAIACVAALPHVFYLYYLGVQQLLRVPPGEAAQFVAIALVAAIVAASLGGAGIGTLRLL